MNNKIAILIISCDKYSDLWEPCTKIFNKFWPDCSFDRYILTNFKEHDVDGFKSIQIGQDKSWSHGLKLALSHLEYKYDYVFTMVEDYYFIEKIDNKYINEMFNLVEKENGDFLSLFRLPSKLERINKFFGRLENNIPYRQSVGFTLWKIRTLYNILDEDENAWEFEKRGVIRGFAYSNFFGSFKNYKVLNLVVKGKIVPKEYAILKLLYPNLIIDRPFLSKKEVFMQKIWSFVVNNILFYTPSCIKKMFFLYKIKK